ncbi:MAG: hypothetical protein LBR93_11605, partial [Treponema sp.]|nr:hypothetical protein [Treponema sp.]
RGEAAHQAGYGQLAEYLMGRGRKEGYLLSFDFRRESRRKAGEGWVTVKSGDGEELRIFDVVL